MKQLLQRIQSFENEIGCTDDAVIHKAMQEGLEFVEALSSNDLAHSKEELCDVLSNVLSAYVRISGSYEIIPQCNGVPYCKLDLAIALGKRNDAIQKYRGIYSRTSIGGAELRSRTESLLGIMRSCVEQKGLPFDIHDLLTISGNKFESRVGLYNAQVNLDSYIASIPDFPKPGILFKDISPLLKDPKAFHNAVSKMSVNMKDADVIVGLDARGFIFGTAIAQLLDKPFVMLRKKGKLPGECIDDNYDLEYGSNTQSLQKDSLKAGDKVAIVDDLLATGGTVQSAIRLIASLGAEVQGCHVLIELDDLGARAKMDIDVYSVLHY